LRSSLFGRLLALFLVVPFVELVLLVWIGERVGFWPTVGLVVATALAGSWLAKREGLAALARFQARLAAGQPPGRELTDGLIILVAGILLLTPGVLTDVAGLLGLLPPTRALIRRQLEQRVRRAVAGGRVGFFAAGPPFATGTPFGAPPTPSVPAPAPARAAGGEVEEATVIEEVEGATAPRPPAASP
jgi:UPF0716 protein FxsA